MKLLVHINQRDSIRKGENAPDSTAVFDLDPGLLPAEHRDFFANHFDLKTGELRITVAGFYRHLTITAPVTKENVLAGIAALKAESDAETARLKADEDESRRNRRHNSLLARDRGPQEKFTHLRFLGDRFQDSSGGSDTETITFDHWDCPQGNYLVRYLDWPYSPDESVVAEARALTEELHRGNDERKAALEVRLRQAKAERQQQKAAAERAAAEKQQRVDAQLREAIMRLGTDMQREKLARGKWDYPEEALRLLRDDAFAPLADLARYTPLTKGEVLAAVNQDFADTFAKDDVEFTTPAEAGAYTDAEMALILRVEREVPGATAVVNLHNGYINWHKDGYAADVYRRSVKATLTVGDLTLHGQFAAP